MSIKASVFIATSLDGFIERADGDLDWLTGGESTSTEQDYGYQEFMDSVDTIVIGRNTFEPVLTFDTWPYSGKKVVVLSSRPSAVPPTSRIASNGSRYRRSVSSSGWHPRARHTSTWTEARPSKGF